jgi:hypothetical protein
VAKLPRPPAPEVLAALAPAVRRLPAGTRLWRVYFRGGAHPGRWNQLRTFGPTTARFDHQVPAPDGEPREQERGIQYAALDGITPLAEVFQDTRVIDRFARSPWLVAYDLAAPLDLLDLTGSWPTRAGASMLLNCGARARAREWSRAFYDAYPQADGLLYGSCMHANRPAVGLWERGHSAIPVHPVFHRALADKTLRLSLRNAAVEIGYLLV